MTKLRFDKKDYLNLGGQPLSGTTFVNWLKMLIENRFRIDWQFIPKAIYVIMMILTMTPFRILEKKKFDKQKENIKIAPLIFIIGHWRSGTTFLHYLMGQDKGIAYVSTFETMTPNNCIENEKMFKGLVANHLPNKRPMDDLELNANLPYEEEYAIANISPYSFYHAWYFPKKINYYFKKYVLFEGASNENVQKWKDVYSYLLKKISYKYDGKPIMLKSLVNTGRVKLLLEMFPDAKFIHIYRNPYKVYVSTWKLYKNILPMFSFQHVEIEEFDRSILDIYKGLYKKYFEEKNLISKENIVEISYEEFIEDPVNTLKTVYEKLGIKGFEKAKPAFEKYAKKHEDYQPNNYKINESIKEKVYREWKFAFKEFGYKK